MPDLTFMEIKKKQVKDCRKVYIDTESTKGI